MRALSSYITLQVLSFQDVNHEQIENWPVMTSEGHMLSKVELGQIIIETAFKHLNGGIT